eukprot:gene32514-41277_t
MQAVKTAYAVNHPDQSLIKAIKANFMGPLEKLLLGLLDTPEIFLAKKIKAACDGFGTDERTLARILGRADKHFVKKIAKAFE